ncbi:hypothetical protein RRG08_055468 [Elysia crispata]|uniref:Uncharacterized protein n=1 Tax=Elysia crispata TaxID=231223 RepID=A0AAE1CRD2_9GAST|nr:hypothetical protein RRG08_055468 [Elysia crispata]
MNVIQFTYALAWGLTVCLHGPGHEALMCYLHSLTWGSAWDRSFLYSFLARAQEVGLGRSLENVAWPGLGMLSRAGPGMGLIARNGFTGWNGPDLGPDMGPGQGSNGLGQGLNGVGMGPRGRSGASRRGLGLG